MADLGLGLEAFIRVGSGGGGRAPQVLPRTTLLSNMMLAGYGISSWSACSKQTLSQQVSQGAVCGSVKLLPRCLVDSAAECA